MTYSSSTPFTGPFGCPVPNFAPSFGPNFGPGYSASYSPAFNQNCESCSNPPFAPGAHHAPYQGFAPTFANFSNAPTPFGWTPASWSNNPSWLGNHSASQPAWNNSFNAASPAWQSGFNSYHPTWNAGFTPSNPSSHNPNNWYGPQFAQPQFTPSHFGAFNPFASNFAPATGASSWFANPNAHSAFGPSYFQAPTPWFAPYNWTNPHANHAWNQPGSSPTNASHANPSPYSVATPTNPNSARDAA